MQIVLSLRPSISSTRTHNNLKASQFLKQIIQKTVNVKILRANSQWDFVILLFANPNW